MSFAGLAFPLARPLLHAIDAETAHGLTIRALRMLPAGTAPAADPRLAVDAFGLRFPNPLGLAAGFDKNAEVPDQMLALGFGFTEIGTVTPLPQAGNPRPRLFRLAGDAAVINRMGFNNEGHAAALKRLEARKGRGGILGVNIGANKESADRIGDYVLGIERFSYVASYFTVNISSPNTPGLRALQGREQLDDLLGRIDAARPAAPAARVPVFLKIAPDLIADEIGMIVEASLAHRIDGLIVSNTTLERPETLRSPDAHETGGLSGAPIRPFAEKALRAAAEAAQGRLPLIAVGGIDSGAEAYARIRLGASAVQVYSALIYDGPGLITRIKRDLAARLRADGFSSISAAIGASR